MSAFRAIETRYNGYRFRSRLEARWAVFFDTAGADYEYEPEGFVLNDGSTYLPDFWLPTRSSFFEIKPSGFSPEERHTLFAKYLHGTTPLDSSTYSTLYVLSGPPYLQAGLPVFRFWHFLAGFWHHQPTTFTACTNCGAMFWWYLPVNETPVRCNWCEATASFRVTDAILGAYARAQSARFEFGESG